LTLTLTKCKALTRSAAKGLRTELCGECQIKSNFVLYIRVTVTLLSSIFTAKSRCFYCWRRTVRQTLLLVLHPIRFICCVLADVTIHRNMITCKYVIFRVVKVTVEYYRVGQKNGLFFESL